MARNRAPWSAGRAAIAAGLLLLPGCYGRQIASLEVRTARIEDEVTSLQRMHTDLAATLQATNKLVSEEVELARSGRAGNEERLKEIQRLLQILATKLDESSVKMSELKDEA